MIQIFTDFGGYGPYVGEMKAVLARDLPGTCLVDLMHDAPAFNPRASAYLLTALSKQFVAGDICLAVVDPGVGDHTRRAIIVEAGGVRYIGPDNGLFALVVRSAAVVKCEEILWRPAKLSNSFHGRDLFAPVVNRIARGIDVETRIIPVGSLVGTEYPDQLGEIIYIDHYGNAVTGLAAERVSRQETLQTQAWALRYARTFSSAVPEEPFWYINSMGLVEIAVNQGNASNILGLSVGMAVELSD